VFYLFYQSRQIPPKYSTRKEIRAWISLCTVAGEIVNGLPFPMMLVDNAKAMMAVVVCYSVAVILLTVGGRNDEQSCSPRASDWINDLARD
jgi:hypothetical protein